MSSNGKIETLVISDESPLLRMAIDVLCAHPRMNCRVSSSVPAVADLCEQRLPDVVLVGTGWCDKEAAELRQWPKSRPAALVALLDSERPEQADAVLEWGFDDYYLLRAAPTDLPVRVELAHRKRVEAHRQAQAVDECHRWLDKAERLARVGCWELEVATGKVTISPGLERLYGIEPGTFKGTLQDAISYAHPDDVELLEAATQRAIETRRSWPVEYRLRTSRGEIRHVVTSGDIEFAPGGEPLKIFGALIDITQRKESERALRESEEHCRAVVEQMPVMIVALDEAGSIVLWNRKAEAVSGYSAREMAANPQAIDLVHLAGHFPNGHEKPWGRAGDFEDWEVNLTTRDGEQRVISWSNIADRVPIKGWSAWAIGVDVTNRVETEEKLRRQQVELAHVARLSHMGEMVASIAHEVNQPLYAIGNYAHAVVNALQRSNPDYAKVRSWCTSIAQMSSRAGQIIRRIRDFTRRRPVQFVPVSINTVVHEATVLLQAEMRSAAVELVLALDPSDPVAGIDRIQIQQVLVNLLQNAADAMQETATRQRRVIVRTAQTTEGMIRVSIEDSGPGLGEQQAEQIFEPFFTTKLSGMGMGLAISRKIIDLHAGSIWAEPNDQGGATFAFLLPIATSEAMP